IITSAGKRFAFVGTILESGLNTAPRDLTGATVLDRRLFISILATGGGYGMITKVCELTIGGTSIDSNYFPTRIIEVPTQLYGGLFVTGIGAMDVSYTGGYDDPKGFFYFRTDFGLTPYDFVSLDDPNNISNFFSGGSL